MKRIVVLLVMIGCGDGGSTSPDASVNDASVNDASVNDASVNDANTDSGVVASDASMDAGVDAGPQCPLGAICDNPALNYAFVTSTTRIMGDIGGLAGADAICNDAATTAGLPGTYVAWLSSSSENAVDRVGTASGWLRIDQRPFAQNLADLIAGNLRYPLLIDENGEYVDEATIVPTATAINGTLSGPETCADWTDSTPTRRPLGGNIESGSGRWTRGYLMNCNMVVRLYCLGVDSDQAYSLPIVEGRRAWLSEGSLPGNAGLAAADALCVAEGLGLTGTARALLATSNASAMSRFDVSGAPWIRPDGIPVWAAPATDLIPLTPLVQQFDGVFLDRRVWSGASNMHELATDNCNDWTSSDGIVQAYSSVSDALDTSWFGNGRIDCDRSTRVYCLED